MRPFAEQRFAAMGTHAHVVVVGPEAERRVGWALERVLDLEQRWSRFEPTSEVSRMNDRGGQRVAVSSDTMTLVEHGVAAWTMTDGAFDPTMADQLVRAGYDRDFALIADREEAPRATPGRGCADVVTDRRGGMVELPSGVRFDPGGFGKGLAADMVVQALLDDGAQGAMVNLGGDLTARGLPVEGDEWVVTIGEPTVAERPLATVHLRDGSLATSTTAKRRWQSGDEQMTHLLDPASGRPIDGPAVLASVIAGSAWWAEVCATTLLVSGTRTTTNESLKVVSSLLVRDDGHVERSGGFERFEA